MNLSKYNIKFKRAITRWEESLPIGNGKLGCMIYGGGPVCFAVDRVDLWDKRVNETTKDVHFNFKNLVKYSTDWTEENVKQRDRLFESIYDNNAYPSKISAGKLIIDFNEQKDEIVSEVDLRSATAYVNFSQEQKIESFCSAVRFIGVARIYGKYDFNIVIPSYISNPCDNNNLGYPKTVIQTDENFCWYQQKTFTEYSYGIVVYKKHCDGFDELYYDVASSDDGDESIERAKQNLKSLADIGYEQLKREHIAWWHRYWKQSELSINNDLLETTYYRSTYLFASCSRKGYYPMALQGVWTADNDKLPPWRGDYHYDTNVQLSYSSYLKANRLKEGEVLLDYIWNNRKVFENFTKRFYGVKGMLLPACSTIDCNPLGGWAHYSLSPTMTIWTIRCFDEYYLYTGNESYLKNRVYPIFKKTGEAISALLTEKKGKLYLPISTSPEIYDNTQKAYLEPNSNFDLALLIYLFQRLKSFAEQLGEDSRCYADILSKLDPIAVDEEKVVMLDKNQRLPESHRHFSHVMCMHPLRLIQYDTEAHKEIFENTLHHLELLGTGQWVGFSYPMSANLYAMANKGNAAYERLEEFSKAFVSDNGFHLNGDFKGYGLTQWHYQPFTLEASFAFCDALQETLLQEQQGYVHLFPALPERLKRASFKKFRSYGGILIDGDYENGYTVRAKFSSKRENVIKVKNTFRSTLLCIETEEGKEYVNCPVGQLFALKLRKGKCVVYGV